MVFADEEALPYVVPPDMQLASMIGQDSPFAPVYTEDKAKKLRKKHGIRIRRRRKVKRYGYEPRPRKNSGKLIVFFTYETEVLDSGRRSNAIVGYDLVVGIRAFIGSTCVYDRNILARKYSKLDVNRRVVSAPFRVRAAFNEAVAALLPDEE